MAIQRLLSGCDRPTDQQAWFTLTEAEHWWMQWVDGELWVQHSAAWSYPLFIPGWPGGVMLGL